MSEIPSNGDFNTTPEQDFNTVAFQGSMQQVLQDNIGSYVLIEFLIGSNSLETRQGILYSVASQFLVLFDELNQRYVVCDIFSVKFVTFLVLANATVQPRTSLGTTEATDSTATAASEPAVPTMARSTGLPLTPAQAAYTYAVRRTPVVRRNQ